MDPFEEGEEEVKFKVSVQVNSLRDPTNKAAVRPFPHATKLLHDQSEHM